MAEIQPSRQPGSGPPPGAAVIMALLARANEGDRADARRAGVVELRFFGGLSVNETAATTCMSVSTVAREWHFARIWLHREWSGEPAA